MTTWPIHGEITGPIVMIGFGSIGRGTLPLIERHFTFDRSRLVVIDPSDVDRRLVDERGYTFVHQAVTRENYRDLLAPFITRGGGQAFIVNLSVDVDSIELMKLAQDMGVQYIDTVVEPWPGFYFGSTLPNADRTNYPLRERVRELGKAYVGGPTAVSCCGANPGMVSWLLKEALLRQIA